MHNCHSAIAVHLEHAEMGCNVPLLSFPADKTALHTVDWHLIYTCCPNTLASANSPLNAHETVQMIKTLVSVTFHTKRKKRVKADSKGQQRDFT